MKKLMLVTCLMFQSIITFAQDNNGIEVVGKASLLAMPDQFSLTIEIRERGKSASKTKALVDSKSAQVIKVFKKNDVDDKTIESSQVRIYPVYEKPSIAIDQFELKNKINKNEKVSVSANNHQDEIQTIVRFEVSRTIKVMFSQLSVYDKVLDSIVKLGVSQVYPLEMTFSEPELYYEKALFQAIANAKDKAEKIAKQANVKLGGLLSMKESAYHSPSQYRMASEASSGFASQVTEKAISAQVIAIYDIAH